MMKKGGPVLERRRGAAGSAASEGDRPAGDGGDGHCDCGPALRISTEGTVLELEVQPAAGRPGRLSFDPWRKRLRLSVGARAEAGKANAEVLQRLSSLLDLPERQLRILSGATERRKSVLVAGLPVEVARERLNGALRGC